ncbi:MAG: TIM-barrel domain-containing protein [Anaerocolumna sp.]
MFDIENIENGVWKLTLGEPETMTPNKLRNFDINSEALYNLKSVVLKPAVISNLQWNHSNRGLTITLPMDSSEDIYGFGLQLKSMNHAGRRRFIKVNSDPPADTGESHAPVPFYVSTAGYGLFVDSYRYITFHMGTVTQKGVSAEKKEENVMHKEFSESALYALKKAKEERKVIIEIPGVRGITLYFFAGDIKEVVMRYNLFSGGGCTPPMWGLGMWYRTYGGSSQDTVRDLVKQIKEDRMPLDVLGLEPGWHSHSYSCSFKWSYLFKEPQKMIEELIEQGIKINLWEHLYVYPTAPFYDDIKEYSGDYEVWNGLVPDFATEKARDIFSEYHKKTFIDKGIMGFKLDECDNSDYNPSNWSFPDSTKFPSGMDGEQMHMAIGMLYQNLLFDAYRERGIRTYSQVRSAGALAAPLPFVLYSDLYNHKQFIRGMVTSGFSGLLWAPEVRDCKDGNDLLRRVQTIVFSAHALFNSWRIPNPPWKQVDISKNLEGVWMEEAAYYTDECRQLMELRMELLPYLYSAFVAYEKEGIPPVRALVMDYPDDVNVRNIDDQYMFGDNLLVCPLTIEDGTARDIYLPHGKWYDFFTGEVIEGGCHQRIDVAYNKIPVYVKDNSLLPLARPVMCIKPETIFQIRVRVFGDGEASFTLYEDDYQSFAYESGIRNKVIINKDKQGVVTYTRIGSGRINLDIQIN